jgi:hypothetical protein
MDFSSDARRAEGKRALGRAQGTRSQHDRNTFAG